MSGEQRLVQKKDIHVDSGRRCTRIDMHALKFCRSAEEVEEEAMHFLGTGPYFVFFLQIT